MTKRITTGNDRREDKLYRPLKPGSRKVALTAVPYSLWNNRGDGEMRVWIRRVNP